VRVAGATAYGSYDHHHSVEADRAQRHAKIIIPVQAAYLVHVQPARQELSNEKR
jgi:hypothetical protein